MSALARSAADDKTQPRQNLRCNRGDATTVNALSATPAPVAPPASSLPESFARVSSHRKGSQPARRAEPRGKCNKHNSSGCAGGMARRDIHQRRNTRPPAPVSGLGIGSHRKEREYAPRGKFASEHSAAAIRTRLTPAPRKTVPSWTSLREGADKTRRHATRETCPI